MLDVPQTQNSRTCIADTQFKDLYRGHRIQEPVPQTQNSRTCTAKTEFKDPYRGHRIQGPIPRTKNSRTRTADTGFKDPSGEVQELSWVFPFSGSSSEYSFACLEPCQGCSLVTFHRRAVDFISAGSRKIKRRVTCQLMPCALPWYDLHG